MNRAKARESKFNGAADPLRFSRPHHVPYAAMGGLHSAPMSSQFSQPHGYQPFGGSSNNWQHPGPQMPFYGGSYSSPSQGFMTGYTESHGLNVNSASSFYNHQYGKNASQNYNSNRPEQGPIPTSYASAYEPPIVLPDIPSSALRPRSDNTSKPRRGRPRKSVLVTERITQKAEKKRKNTMLPGLDAAVTAPIDKDQSKKIKNKMRNTARTTRDLSVPLKGTSSEREESDTTISSHYDEVVAEKFLLQNDGDHPQKKQLPNQKKVSRDPGFRMSLRSALNENISVTPTVANSDTVDSIANLESESKVAHLVKVITDAVEIAAVAADQLREMFPALKLPKWHFPQGESPITSPPDSVNLTEPLPCSSGTEAELVNQNVTDVTALVTPSVAAAVLNSHSQNGFTSDVISDSQQDDRITVSTAPQENTFDRDFECGTIKLSQQVSQAYSEQSIYFDEWDSSDETGNSSTKDAPQTDIPSTIFQIRAAWVPVAMDE